MPIHRLTPELIGELNNGYPNLSDLNLADNEIRVVAHLDELLSPLRKLNLSNNQVHDIDNLATQTQLRELYLSGNSITSLAPLARLTNLEVLHVADNALTDLAGTLRLLRGLPNLQRLVLEGNALAQAPNYRALVVTQLRPTLRFLDFHEVTEAERKYLRLTLAEDADELPRDDELGVRHAPAAASSAVHAPLQGVQHAGQPSTIMSASAATYPDERGVLRNRYHHVMQERVRMEADVSRASRREQDAEFRAAQLESRVAELEAELEASRAEIRRHLGTLSDRVVDNRTLKEQVATLERERDEERAEVRRLKAYFGPLVQDKRGAAADGCGDEGDGYEGGNARAGSAVAVLRDQVDLLNVRVASLREIVAIHERTAAEGEEEKTQLLLMRWREKVFSLLVRLRSDELTARKERAAREAEDRAHEARVRALESDLAIARQEVTGREAELKIAQTQARVSKSALEQERAAGERRAQLLAHEREAVGENVRALSVLPRQMDDWAFGVLQEAKRLDGYMQRLAFASRRLSAFQAALERKMRRQAAREARPSEPVVVEIADGEAREEADGALALVAALREQIAQVERERDELALRLDELRAAKKEAVDAEREELDARLRREVKRAAASGKETASTLEDALKRRMEQVSELEADLGEQRQRVAAQGRRLAEQETLVASLQEQLDERTERVAELETQLRSEQDKYERGFQHAVTTASIEADERISSAESERAQLSRENAKLVVETRQLERQIRRLEEKASLEDEAKTAFLEDKVEAAEARANDLRKERNALLAALRQHEKVAPGRRRTADGGAKKRGKSGKRKKKTGFKTASASSSSSSAAAASSSASSSLSDASATSKALSIASTDQLATLANWGNKLLKSLEQ